MSRRAPSSDSSNFKTITGLSFGPGVATAFILNTAFIKFTLEALTSLERVKTKDPTTLRNIYKDAPGHVPTQLNHYLDDFAIYVFKYWENSIKRGVGDNLQIVDNAIKSYFQVSEKDDIWNDIKVQLEELKKKPSPNPSPTNWESSRQSDLNQGNEGVV